VLCEFPVKAAGLNTTLAFLGRLLLQCAPVSVQASGLTERVLDMLGGEAAKAALF
jgi:hypothetical protein